MDTEGKQPNRQEQSRLPRHVAIIMDGNGRWAQARSMPRQAGHRVGVDSVRAVVETCGRLGIRCLTLFAFSSENWRRPSTEVSVLMQLFLRTLDKEVKRLHKNKVRLRFIGDRSRFSEALQRGMADAEELTAGNSGIDLNIAVSYGGRWDIADAARRLGRDLAAGRVAPEAVDEELFGSYVALSDLPEPDLFIRTGGEQRISNFLLWQLAYTELYFTETLWPDFREAEMEQAVADYAQRQRRFGLTGEQAERAEHA